MAYFPTRISVANFPGKNVFVKFIYVHLPNKFYLQCVSSQHDDGDCPRPLIPPPPPNNQPPPLLHTHPSHSGDHNLNPDQNFNPPLVNPNSNFQAQVETNVDHPMHNTTAFHVIHQAPRDPS